MEYKETNEIQPSNQKPSKRKLIVTIIIFWFLYLSIAWLPLGFSFMAFDSGPSTSAYLLVLMLNGFPLIGMIVLTIMALKKQSWVIAILMLPIAYVLFFLASDLHSKVDYFLTKDIRKEQARLMNSCPEGMYFSFGAPVETCIPNPMGVSH